MNKAMTQDIKENHTDYAVETRDDKGGNIATSIIIKVGFPNFWSSLAGRWMKAGLQKEYSQLPHVSCFSAYPRFTCNDATKAPGYPQLYFLVFKCILYGLEYI